MSDIIKLIPLHYKFTGATNDKEYAGYEHILLEQNGCPVTMFHVDLLWTTPEHKEIHEKLCQGQTIECELILREVTK